MVFIKTKNRLMKNLINFLEAYFKIFNRCGINVVKVAADSGAIGGKVSSEFISVSDSGEDTILICESCNYSANEEKAEFIRSIQEKNSRKLLQNIEEVETVGIENDQLIVLSEYFQFKYKEHFLKTMVYIYR